MDSREDFERLAAEAVRDCPPREPGLRGAEMHSVASFLEERGDWETMVRVRSTLERLADSRSERRDGEELFDPEHIYRFGVSVLSEKLRTSAPPRFAVLGLSARVASVELAELVTGRSWRDLNRVVNSRAVRRRLAQEFVARGEDLTVADVDHEPGDPPLALQEWEPQPYGDFEPSEDRSSSFYESLPVDVQPEPRDAVARRLDSYADGWLHHDTVKVRGSVLHAIAGLGYGRAEITRLMLAEALDQIACAIAFGTGGRGSGLLWPGRRFGWSLLAALAGTTTEAVSPEQLGRAGTRVSWFHFVAESEDEIYCPRRFLAIEDPAAGIAWALTASDSWD